MTKEMIPQNLADVKGEEGRKLVVGIDVGSRYGVAVACLREGDGKIVYKDRFKVYQDRRSYELFSQRIEEWKRKYGCDTVVIGMEPTLTVWKPLYRFLKDKGYVCVLVACMTTSTLKRTVHSSPNKTDIQDAKTIGNAVWNGYYSYFLDRSEEIEELRSLCRYHYLEGKDLTRLKNRARGILYYCFPEVLDFFKDIFSSRSGMYLLEHYPFPEDIVSVGFDKLWKELREVSHGLLRAERVASLVGLARESIGFGFGGSAEREQLRWIIREIREKIERKLDLEREIRARVEGIEESKYMMSIDGVGYIGCGTIIGETGGLSKFKTVKQLLKYCGLDLYEHSSGKMESGRRISKYGNAYVRHIIGQLGFIQFQEGKPFHWKYLRLKARGKSVDVIRVAIGIHILRVMFALVRDKKFFDPSLFMVDRVAV